MKTSVLLTVLICVATGSIDAQQFSKGSAGTAREAAGVMYDFIGINNMMMYVANNGDMSFNPTTKAAGLEFPIGAGSYVVYEEGLIWGGMVKGSVRVGGSFYRHGLVPGTLDANGNRIDSANPRFRIYKVRKTTREEFARMSGSDAARLRTDYTEWPVTDGAPFTDRDGVKGYHPHFERWLDDRSKSEALRTADEPLLIGDEVLWFVSNDMDATATRSLYGSDPIGLEVHTLVWAFRTEGPLMNTVFTKHTLINKSANDIAEMYVSKYIDPDVGDANNDYFGVDQSLGLAFAYDGTEDDVIYPTPVAVGFDFVQGPIVPADANDSGRFGFRIRKGSRNLPVTSFIGYLGGGNSTYRDPSQGIYSGSVEMYNNQKGDLWNGQPVVDPSTGKATRFMCYGDPIERTGWCDGVPAGPGDRRMLFSSGPFTLARGDTQEVVTATMIARGIDRLSSVRELKQYDRIVQQFCGDGYIEPSRPPTPSARAIVTSDRFVLEWGEKSSADSVERWSTGGWKFEGYNVYQLRSPQQTLADATRIATFDAVNNVGAIFDWKADPQTGILVERPVQLGTDLGIRRSITIGRDSMNHTALKPNGLYTFAVTAYTYNADRNARPRSLESLPTIVTVRMSSAMPGWREAMAGDSLLPIVHARGTATRSPEVRVVAPTKLTGHEYEVTFTTEGKISIPFDNDEDPGTPSIGILVDDYSWNVTDKTTNTPRITRARQYNDPHNAYICDGFRIGLNGTPYWIPGSEILGLKWVDKNDKDVPPIFNHTTEWSLGTSMFGTKLSPWETAKSVRITFDRSKKSKGYMYLRGGTPNYEYRGYFESPITVWDVSDAAKPKQLSYAFCEQLGGSYQNNEWNPGNTSGDREYLFIIDEPYSGTPNPNYTGTFRINSNAADMPILYTGWYFSSAAHQQTNPKDYRWNDGDGWIILANIPYSSNDIFTFRTSAAKFDAGQARRDAERVTVFPNPYFGSNSEETSFANRFVTFQHLASDATIRISTLAGSHVRTIQKSGQMNPYAIWDLRNDAGGIVGSGMYIIHVTMPSVGIEKTLKLAVIMEEQAPSR